MRALKRCLTWELQKYQRQTQPSEALSNGNEDDLQTFAFLTYHTCHVGDKVVDCGSVFMTD